MLGEISGTATAITLPKYPNPVDAPFELRNEFRMEI